MATVKRGPQAVNDRGRGYENDQISLDVRANDLGGKNHRLWSLNQSDLASVTADGDRQTLSSGAQIWFDNGLVRYDPLGAWNHLASGATATETFLYAIRMGNGSISYASVELTIVGTNDEASIDGISVGIVKEDVTLTISGTLAIHDADDGEATLKPLAAGTAGLSAHGTFQVLANGDWTYHLDNNAADVQALNAGEVLTDSILVQSFDGTASQTITVTICGTDDYNLILGTPLADHLEGTAGNDHIIGNGAYDFLNGLAGNDWLELSDQAGGEGYGGAGNDRLVGGNGDGGTASVFNLLSGGDGQDRLFGGNGDHGATVFSELHGGAGNDNIIGGSALDTNSYVRNWLWADGGGNDELLGGANAYNVFYLADGGPGDIARGGATDLQGYNVAFVYRENPPPTYENHITANPGYLDYNGAQLWGMKSVYAGGGFGDYTATVSGDLGLLNTPNFYLQVWANSFDASDTLILDASGATSTTVGVELVINAQPHSKNYLTGGAGPDRLFSYNYGDDTIVGGAGNDLIVGGWGDNTIDGGTGNDQISLWGYGPGTDTVIFGANSGNDRVDTPRGDVFDISAYGQFHSFADVLAAATSEYVGGWWITTVQLDANNSVMFTQTSLTDLAGCTFIYAG